MTLRSSLRTRSYFSATSTFWILGILSLLLFSWLLANPYLRDPDLFYHITMAHGMRDLSAISQHFPALPLTSLAHTFADQAWLYHLLLMPFIALWGDIIGIKALSVVIATAVMLSIYAIARRWHAPAPLLFPAIALLSSPFIFRLALGKPSALAALLLIWGVSALLARRPWILAALCLTFVWAHGAWPLLLSMTFLAALLMRNWRMALIPLGGAITGLVLNPYFPANLTFFWQQTILIGLKGYRTIIGVGSEWYPYPLIDFLAMNALLLSVSALSVWVMLIRRDRTPPTQTLFWSAGAVALLTLRANRNIEFLTPLLLLLAAWVFSQHKSSLVPYARRLLPARARHFIISLAGILLLISSFQIFNLRPLLAQGYRYDTFTNASQWLASHVQTETRIINTRWEDFPVLWYRNPQLQFVIGLDPAFLHLSHPATYALWQRLRAGDPAATTPTSLRQIFSSNIIFVKKEFLTLHNTLAASSDWTLAYADDEVWIFTTAEGSDAFEYR